MKFFWPIYLFTAVVTTAVAYVAGPMARPLLKPLFSESVMEGGERGELIIDNGELIMGMDRARAGARGSQGGGELEGAGGVERARAGARGSQGVERGGQVRDDDDDLPPALKKIFIANARDTPEWGITRQEANFYKLDGTRMGKIGGGIVFDCNQIRNSSRGAMVECRFKQSNGSEKTLLLSRKEVHLFTGKFEDLSQKQQEALQRYYTLTGKIVVRKAEILEAASQKNPYFKSYQEAYKRYLEHVEKAKELVAQRDAASELVRANLENQLRAMKSEENRIKAELDATDVKYREWKAQHPESQVNPAEDAQIKLWVNELPVLRKVIPGLAA